MWLGKKSSTVDMNLFSFTLDRTILLTMRLVPARWERFTCRGRWLDSDYLKILHSAFALSRCILIKSNVITAGDHIHCEVEWLIFKSNEWKAEVHVGHLSTGMPRSDLLPVTCHLEIFKFHFCKQKKVKGSILTIQALVPAGFSSALAYTRSPSQGVYIGFSPRPNILVNYVVLIDFPDTYCISWTWWKIKISPNYHFLTFPSVTLMAAVHHEGKWQQMPLAGDIQKRCPNAFGGVVV